MEDKKQDYDDLDGLTHIMKGTLVNKEFRGSKSNSTRLEEINSSLIAYMFDSETRNAFAAWNKRFERLAWYYSPPVGVVKPPIKFKGLAWIPPQKIDEFIDAFEKMKDDFIENKIKKDDEQVKKSSKKVLRSLTELFKDNHKLWIESYQTRLRAMELNVKGENGDGGASIELKIKQDGIEPPSTLEEMLDLITVRYDYLSPGEMDAEVQFEMRRVEAEFLRWQRRIDRAKSELDNIDESLKEERIKYADEVGHYAEIKQKKFEDISDQILRFEKKRDEIKDSLNDEEELKRKVLREYQEQLHQQVEPFKREFIDKLEIMFSKEHVDRKSLDSLRKHALNIIDIGVNTQDKATVELGEYFKNVAGEVIDQAKEIEVQVKRKTKAGDISVFSMKRYEIGQVDIAKAEKPKIVKNKKAKKLFTEDLPDELNTVTGIGKEKRSGNLKRIDL